VRRAVRQSAAPLLQAAVVLETAAFAERQSSPAEPQCCSRVIRTVSLDSHAMVAPASDIALLGSTFAKLTIELATFHGRPSARNARS